MPKRKTPVDATAELLQLNQPTSRVPSNAEWAWRLVVALLIWSAITAGAFVTCRYLADLLTAVVVTVVLIAGGGAAVWVAMRWIFSVSLIQRSMMAVGYALAGTLFVRSFGFQLDWGENIPFAVRVRTDEVEFPVIMCATVVFLGTQMGVVASQLVQGWFSRRS